MNHTGKRYQPIGGEDEASRCRKMFAKPHRRSVGDMGSPGNCGWNISTGEPAEETHVTLEASRLDLMRNPVRQNVPTTREESSPCYRMS